MLKLNGENVFDFICVTVQNITLWYSVLKYYFFQVYIYVFYVFLRVQFTVNNLWRQVVIEHELPPKENTKTQKRKVSNADFNLYDKQRLC